jgi:hypothetical protein
MNPKVTREQLLAEIPKRHKFGIIQTAKGIRERTYRGIVYHSKGEADYAQQLDILKLAGEIRDWKRQVEYPLYVNGVHCCTFFADFEVYKGHTTPIVVDVKGHQTPESKIKIKLMKAVYGIDVLIVLTGTAARKKKTGTWTPPQSGLPSL